MRRSPSWLKSDALQPTLTGARRGLAHRCRAASSGAGGRASRSPSPDSAARKLAAPALLRSTRRRRSRSAAPLVLVLDDLQWADADTIEWLQYFLRSASGSPCLVVATVRAEEEQDNPPLGRLLGQLRTRRSADDDRARPARSRQRPPSSPVRSPSSRWTRRRRRARSATPKAIRSSSSNAAAWSWRDSRDVRRAASCRACSLLLPRAWRCSPTRRAQPQKSPPRSAATFSSTPGAGQRSRGARARPRARRALAAPHRPRAGGRAVGLQPRSHSRGRVRRNRPGAPTADPPPHRAGHGAAVRRPAGRGERVACRAPRSRRTARARGPVSRTRRRCRHPRLGERRGDPLPDATRWRCSRRCPRRAIATSGSWRFAPAFRSR